MTNDAIKERCFTQLLVDFSAAMDGDDEVFDKPDFSDLNEVVDTAIMNKLETQHEFMGFFVELKQWHAFVSNDDNVGKDCSSHRQRAKWKTISMEKVQTWNASSETLTKCKMLMHALEQSNVQDLLT